jgi:1-deoxy-D-xylulose-5-phosphate reductoisomerase
VNTDSLVVLGATGSIGTQTLEIARDLGMHVVGLAARMPSPALARLAAEWPDTTVVVTGATGDEARAFAAEVGSARVHFGSSAMVELARTRATVVNGVVGIAGLPASVSALEAGNRLALANKESLVAGGQVIADAAARGGGELIPVDSEHSAIHQLVGATPRNQVHRLVLTASGGPFRGATRSDLAEVTPEQALDHPTWKMGSRITIDSATLANKGLEVIEASLLFDVDIDDVEVVVHPQSLVHSLVRLVDGTMLAHLGAASMRHPIEYAITYPGRADHTDRPFDLAGLSLTFEEPDLETFRALALAYQAGRAGGSAPAVFNAADEIAVAAFLQRRLGFLEIPTVIERCLDQLPVTKPSTAGEVLEIDRTARELAASLIAGSC